MTPASFPGFASTVQSCSHQHREALPVEQCLKSCLLCHRAPVTSVQASDTFQSTCVAVVCIKQEGLLFVGYLAISLLCGRQMLLSCGCCCVTVCVPCTQRWRGVTLSRHPPVQVVVQGVSTVDCRLQVLLPCQLAATTIWNEWCLVFGLHPLQVD